MHEGYSGQLCAECTAMHRLSGKHCIKCSDVPLKQLLFLHLARSMMGSQRALHSCYTPVGWRSSELLHPRLWLPPASLLSLLESGPCPATPESPSDGMPSWGALVPLMDAPQALLPPSLSSPQSDSSHPSTVTRGLLPGRGRWRHAWFRSAPKGLPRPTVTAGLGAYGRAGVRQQPTTIPSAKLLRRRTHRPLSQRPTPSTGPSCWKPSSGSTLEAWRTNKKLIQGHQQTSSILAPPGVQGAAKLVHQPSYEHLQSAPCSLNWCLWNPL